MRAFVLMILVLNLVLFAWYYFGGVSQQNEFASAPHPVDSSIASLVLVEEAPKREVVTQQRALVVPAQQPAVVEDKAAVQDRPAPPVPVVEPAVKETVVAPKIASCYKAGSFAQREQPKGLISLVERFGFEAAVTAKEAEQFFGNWIYLTEYGTIQAARADVSALKQQGITDVAIARLDDGQLIISLGIYGQEASRKRRLEELKRLGYVNHQTKKRFRKVEVYWLVLSGFEGDQQRKMVDELKQTLQASYPTAQLTPVSCQ